MMESKIDFDALKGKRYCKTPSFLKKLHSLFKLLDGIIISTVDIVGWYPKTLHEDDLSSLHKRLESWKEKCISTHILIESADLVLKTTFWIRRKILWQKHATATGMKFAQNWKIKFQKKQNTRHVYGGGVLTTYFLLETRGRSIGKVYWIS